MTDRLFYILLFSMTSTLSFGQKMFSINNASKMYNAKIQVQKCEDGACSGKGTIKIYTKNNSKLIQEFRSEDFNFSLDDNKKISDEEGPLIFDDFNFDGTEDLAIANGVGGADGSPSYDVYVFNISKKQFVLSKELTELASFGMFTIDKKRKRIIAYSKDGCCLHETTEYEVIPKKGLVKVYDLIEDETKGDDNVYVTEEKLSNGKWTKTTKKYNAKDYYKD